MAGDHLPPICPMVGKVQALQEYPAPSTKRQVRKFLGLVSYYHCFVPQFTSIAAPLTELLTTDSLQQVCWSHKCEEAFRLLKDHLCQELVLYNNFTCGFIVQMDTLGVGLSAILSQNVDREEHVVIYISRK